MSERETGILVGQCPECNCVEVPYLGPGSTCMFECQNQDFSPKKLVKRRMWMCEVGLEMYYLTRAEAEDHENHECWI